jgi:hypothetical protein
MKYVLTIYGDESTWGDMTVEDGAREMAAYEAFGRELSEADAFLGGEGLQPTATATTVRVRDGEPMLTDGPFADTREQLGGFYLVEAGDLDEAIPLGGEDPGRRQGLRRGPAGHGLRRGGRRGPRPRRGGA